MRARVCQRPGRAPARRPDVRGANGACYQAASRSSRMSCSRETGRGLPLAAGRCGGRLGELGELLAGHVVLAQPRGADHARAARRSARSGRPRPAPRPGARAPAAATSRLKRSAWGRHTAFIAPCASPKRPPSACAIACPTPMPARSAAPACIAPSSRRRRASRSWPSASTGGKRGGDRRGAGQRLAVGLLAAARQRRAPRRSGPSRSARCPASRRSGRSSVSSVS